ncbi:MAG TPA: hypothetical protein VG603_08555 [Chitinophagales bacterium]|nr:hypothetical protein [Chitinophagales bacterium]
MKLTQNESVFFVGVVHSGTEEQLTELLNSIARQDRETLRIETVVFYKTKPASAPGHVKAQQYSNEQELFDGLLGAMENSNAAYHTLLSSKECFYEGVFEAIDHIFKDYPEINWLTGIQTLQAQKGFNVITGNTACRRWNFDIYEKSLYKSTIRYIPPGSTFWRKAAWQKALPHLYFVSEQSLFADVWRALFKTQKLYTSNIYISSVANTPTPISEENILQYELIEDSWLDRITEFFFVNNLPVLRSIYKNREKLTPVVRFDHKKMSYYLYEY